jgi:hypothetical protein
MESGGDSVTPPALMRLVHPARLDLPLLDPQTGRRLGIVTAHFLDEPLGVFVVPKGHRLRAMRLAAVVTFIVVAIAAPAAASPQQEYVTLTFFGLDQRTKAILDMPPRGQNATKGDVRRWTLTLKNSGHQFSRASGAVVGRAVQTLTFVSRTKAKVTQVAYLPTGTIQSRGVFADQNFKHELRVTGGTRAFAEATGTFEMNLLPALSQGQVYYLRLP